MRYSFAQLTILGLGLAVTIGQAAPVPHPQTPPPAEEQPLLPFELGAIAVPFGPKPEGCSKFELIVARDTSEPGPFGIIVGDSLVPAVSSVIPGARGYAVQYPADESPSALSIGSNDVVQRLVSQDRACADQKFALIGYGLGALVIRDASPKIPDSIQPKILSLVMFSDPGIKPTVHREPIQQFLPSFKAKLFENCAVGDPVCADGTMQLWGSGMGKHIEYNMPGTTYQSESANFIINAFQGTPLPAKETAPGPN